MHETSWTYLSAKKASSITSVSILAATVHATEKYCLNHVVSVVEVKQKVN